MISRIHRIVLTTRTGLRGRPNPHPSASPSALYTGYGARPRPASQNQARVGAESEVGRRRGEHEREFALVREDGERTSLDVGGASDPRRDLSYAGEPIEGPTELSSAGNNEKTAGRDGFDDVTEIGIGLDGLGPKFVLSYSVFIRYVASRNARRNGGLPTF